MQLFSGLQVCLCVVIGSIFVWNIVVYVGLVVCLFKFKNDDVLLVKDFYDLVDGDNWQFVFDCLLVVCVVNKCVVFILYGNYINVCNVKWIGDIVVIYGYGNFIVFEN